MVLETAIVSNCLTGAIVHVNEVEYVSELKSLLNLGKHSSFVHNVCSDLQNYFYENGIFVASDVDEYKLAMYTYQREIIRNTSCRINSKENGNSPIIIYRNNMYD